MREGSPNGKDAADDEGPDVIALVDYGAGNLASVRKALAALGAELTTPGSPADLATASGIIVPGVGHFESTRAIDGRWRGAIREAVDRGTALFGICLGMHWLFEGSAEAPSLPGLGVFEGICGRLPEIGTQKDEIDPTPLCISDSALRTPHSAPRTPHSAPRTPNSALRTPHSAPRTPHSALKIPHVGWNSLSLPRPSTLMAGVAEDAQVYFTHSYVAPVTSATVAMTTYGTPFTSAVESGRIAGVQFHPEKSGDVGLRILANWLASI